MKILGIFTHIPTHIRPPIIFFLSFFSRAFFFNPLPLLSTTNKCVGVGPSVDNQVLLRKTDFFIPQLL